ncbi:unnamed protein product [Protopolystoma xenopodis]|uniref:Uncharacterized protein n=1 Tax=Protopolystoma xenopodis TaxID=117903 RepID=A0A3S5BAQ7_9PLAT|nr:unnamed protein product [Protopolystoma xenopodis]
MQPEGSPRTRANSIELLPSLSELQFYKPNRSVSQPPSNNSEKLLQPSLPFSLVSDTINSLTTSCSLIPDVDDDVCNRKYVETSPNVLIGKARRRRGLKEPKVGASQSETTSAEEPSAFNSEIIAAESLSKTQALQTLTSPYKACPTSASMLKNPHAFLATRHIRCHPSHHRCHTNHMQPRKNHHCKQIVQMLSAINGKSSRLQNTTQSLAGGRHRHTISPFGASKHQIKCLRRGAKIGHGFQRQQFKFLPGGSGIMT